MAFNFLKKVETASSRAQTPYIQFLPDKGQASYLLKVNRLVCDKAEFKGFEYFLVDGEVVESNHPEFPPGSLCSRMMCFYGDKKSEYKDGKSAEEMKQFFVALTGLPESDITEPDILEAVGVTQPLAGKHVRVNVFCKPGEKGGEFTKCVWNHVSDEPAVEPANDNAS